MASPAAQPQAGDATGRALKEGYVVVIPGTRGRNSSIAADKAYANSHKGVKKGQTIYTGRAPKAILDLKAAIRYLRHFDNQMPGDAERIITDGTSAGGAMSALMGATGNNPELPFIRNSVVWPAFLRIITFQGLLRFCVRGLDDCHQVVHLLHLGC